MESPVQSRVPTIDYVERHLVGNVPTSGCYVCAECVGMSEDQRRAIVAGNRQAQRDQIRRNYYRGGQR